MGRPWIKLAFDTPDKPELEEIAAELDVSPNEVLGALVRLWIWFADQTEDGRIRAHADQGRALRVIDRRGGLPGLGTAMCAAGWIVVGEGVVSIPDFEAWTGSAKRARKADAERKARERSRGQSAPRPPDTDRTPTGHDTDSPPEVHPPQRVESREKREDPKSPAGSEQRAPDPPPAAPSPNGSAAALTASGQISTRRAGTPQAELMDFWAEGWLRTRGVPWVATKQDYILAAQVLSKAGGDMAEAQRRAGRLLEEGEDEWLVKNASLALLSKRWNQLGVQVTRKTRQEIRQEEFERTLQDWAAGGAS